MGEWSDEPHSPGRGTGGCCAVGWAAGAVLSSLFPAVPPRRRCSASPTSPSRSCTSCTSWLRSLATSRSTVRTWGWGRGPACMPVPPGGAAGAHPLLPADRVESELLHTYNKVDPFDVLVLCVRVAVLTAVTLTVPIVLFPVSGPVGTGTLPATGLRHQALRGETEAVMGLGPGDRDWWGCRDWEWDLLGVRDRAGKR